MSPALWLLMAVVVDALVGDPRWLPHPIRWMGAAIARGEALMRSLPLAPVISGGLLAVGLIGGTWAIAWGALSIAAGVHPLLGAFLHVTMLFYCLSARSLADAAMGVWQLLTRGDLPCARRAVGMIVGRETAELDTSGVTRAALETVAENLVDGVVAPLFWAAMGGAPLALAFKMTNTLDSMVGYKNDRYREFGKVAARLDDLANWIPARLSIPLIASAAGLLARRSRPAWRLALREGRRHSSPNAGWPEAAFAGALGVWLGGANRYHGRWVQKPTIGKGLRNVSPSDIPKACDLMWLTVLLAALLAVGTRWWVAG